MLIRLFDLIISFIAFLILTPLLLVTGALILIFDGSPVLFYQVRAGKEGPFIIYKFRTYSKEKDIAKRKITKIGTVLRKTSLDELPQLLNILKGDMSIVGCRPELWDNVKSKRRPGLTGLAQVSGRSNIDEAKRKELNEYWEDNISFKLYLAVIVATFKYIILGGFFKDAN